MMRVVVLYTKISAKTVVALNRSGYEFERVKVSDSNEAYWEVLADLWGYGEDFCIVEHDIVVGPDTLREIYACPEPWCVCSYNGPGYSGAGVDAPKGAALQGIEEPCRCASFQALRPEREAASRPSAPPLRAGSGGGAPAMRSRPHTTRPFRSPQRLRTSGEGHNVPGGQLVFRPGEAKSDARSGAKWG
jgi:hypothetical protein